MTEGFDRNDLCLALEEILRKPVLNVRRRPSLYSSSFAIEELEVTTKTGVIEMAFKNLSRHAMLADAANTKPDFLYDPLREINVYRSIHPLLNMGIPKLYGAVTDPSIGRYWMFLERVSASELYECGEFETWLCFARWLARFHASRAADATVARDLAPQLLEHDASYYRTWLQRAHASIGRHDDIGRRYDCAIDLLLALPRTLIHGEVYASNILVEGPEDDLLICPLDLEMAAIGPGILDIAALASGKWTRDQRLRMAQAWCDALPAALRPPDLVTAFDGAQLQIAVQWLGWSDRWSPPQEHAHDWLSEALGLSRQDILSMGPLAC